jgi:hypothetical protein
MATERASSTGVKSLRAMFETNKLENDGHGKAAGSVGIATADKPLAKVRTAFVEVEPSAKLIRKMRSNATLTDSEKENGPEHETAAAGARSNGTNGFHAPNEAAQLLPVVLGNTVSEMAARDESKKATPKPTKSTARTVAPKSSTPNLRPTVAPSSQKPLIRPRTTSKVEPKPKTDPPAHDNDKPKTIRAMPSNSRLGGLKVDKMRHAAPPVPKAPSRVLNSLATPPLSKSRSREVLSTHRTANPAATATPAGHQPKSAGVRSATGFFKPRPKSPTRPILLPAHLVAHTSSSAAKFGAALGPPPPIPHSSEAAPRPPVKSAPVSRRVSSVSAATTTATARPAAAPAASSAAAAAPTRKASTFGPPPKPKPTGGGGPGAAVVRPPDDFLARMMRPTASSSSKVRVVDPVAQSPRVRPRVARKVPSRLSINESAASASASHHSSSEGNTTLSSTASPLRTGGGGAPEAAGTPLLVGRDEIPSSPPLDVVVEDLD